MLMIELTRGGRQVAVDVESIEAIEDLAEGARLHMVSGCLLQVDNDLNDVVRRMGRALSADHAAGTFDSTGSAVTVGDIVLKDDDETLVVADIVHEDEQGTPTIRFLDSAGRSYTVYRDELVTLVAP